MVSILVEKNHKKPHISSPGPRMEHYIFRWFRLQGSNEARSDQRDSKGICPGETDKEQ
jgi:hypothetical protein